MRRRGIGTRLSLHHIVMPSFLRLCVQCLNTVLTAQKLYWQTGLNQLRINVRGIKILSVPSDICLAFICFLEGGILSGHTTFNLKGSSIPTASMLPCCSFGSCHTRLTDGRCSSFILHNCGFGLNVPRQVQEYKQSYLYTNM